MDPLNTHSAALSRIRRWFVLRDRVATDAAILTAALDLYERSLAGVDAVAKSSPRIAADDGDDGEDAGGSDGGWSL